MFPSGSSNKIGSNVWMELFGRSSFNRIGVPSIISSQHTVLFVLTADSITRELIINNIVYDYGGLVVYDKS